MLGKNTSFFEWVIIFGSLIAVIATSEALRISEKWESACAYTIMVFVVVVISLRPTWGRSIFWWRLAGVFVIHVLLISIITQFLPATSQGFSGIPMIIAGIAEVLMVGTILWRGTRQSNQ
jgi:hypothetical protein